jgi:chemotaxis signal transduction protein
LRGKIIAVIDLRVKSHKKATSYDDRACIIVVEVSCILVGLIIDNVSEVI